MDLVAVRKGEHRRRRVEKRKMEYAMRRGKAGKGKCFRTRPR